MTSLLYGSLCSGIEAATVAWEPLGYKAAWFSEIEPFASAALAHHYPSVPNHGDMLGIADKLMFDIAEPVDILVAGTPCQSFSLAGLRGSLSDERGNLTLELINILEANDYARGKPSILIWENVPGVFNTKDNAFGCFLAGLVGEDVPLQPSGRKWANAGCVYGYRRNVAWRVLDAQYFGVPQRRRRVFLIACPTDRDPAEILFERAGEDGNIGAGGEERENPAADIEGSPTVRLASGDAVTGTLLANCGTKLFLGNQEAFGGKYFVIHGNTIGRKLENGGQGIGVSETGYTLTATDRHAVFDGLRVRRLTPIECERLQGFPDNYTLIPYLGKPDCSDNHRYRTLGNSMAVPVMRWIGERINNFWGIE